MYSRVYICVSNGSPSLAFKVQLPGDCRSRFLFYDELTEAERSIVEQCIYAQGGSLAENGWYFADEDVKALAADSYIQHWLERQVASMTTVAAY